MSAAPVGAIGVEFHDAAFREDGRDPRHAEFDGLADREVHPVGARYTLDQGDAKRRFPPDVVQASRLDPDFAAAGMGDHGLVLAARPVEDDEGIALGEAQHAEGVVGRHARELDVGPRAQAIRDMEACAVLDGL